MLSRVFRDQGETEIVRERESESDGTCLERFVSMLAAEV